MVWNIVGESEELLREGGGKMKVSILLVFVLLIFCSKEKKGGPLNLTYTLRGSTTISALKLINSSDSTAYSIFLFKNNEDEPFLTIDSLSAHTDQEFPRSSYVPKITLADKIILHYKCGGHSFKDVFFLARYIPLKGQWEEK